MKNILFVLITLTTMFSVAQTKFDVLEDYDDVSTVVVTKDMFDLLKKFPDAQSKDMELFNALKGLSELKIFSTSASVRAKKMQTLVEQTVSKNHLTQLMRTKDEHLSMKVFVKASANKNVVNEVLMLANHHDQTVPKTTIVVLMGDIDVAMLANTVKKYQYK